MLLLKQDNQTREEIDQKLLKLDRGISNNKNTMWKLFEIALFTLKK